MFIDSPHHSADGTYIGEFRFPIEMKIDVSKGNSESKLKENLIGFQGIWIEDISNGIARIRFFITTSGFALRIIPNDAEILGEKTIDLNEENEE